MHQHEHDSRPAGLTPLQPVSVTIGPDTDRPGMATLAITRGTLGHQWTMSDGDLAAVAVAVAGWLETHLPIEAMCAAQPAAGSAHPAGSHAPGARTGAVPEDHARQ